MIQPAGDEEARSNALTELSLRVQEFDQEGNLAPAPSAGAFPFLSVLFSSDAEDVSLSLPQHRPERAGMVRR